MKNRDVGTNIQPVIGIEKRVFGLYEAIGKIEERYPVKDFWASHM